MKKIYFLSFLFICLFAFTLNVNALSLTESYSYQFTTEEIEKINNFIKNDDNIQNKVHDLEVQYPYYLYYIHTVTDSSIFRLRIYFFENIPTLKLYGGYYIYFNCPSVRYEFEINNLVSVSDFSTNISSCDFNYIANNVLVYNNNFSYVKYFDSNFDLYFDTSFTNYPVTFSYLGNDYSLTATDVFPTMLSYYNLSVDEENTQTEEKSILLNFVTVCIDRINFFLSYMFNSYIFMFIFGLIIVYLIIIMIRKFFMR